MSSAYELGDPPPSGDIPASLGQASVYGSDMPEEPPEYVTGRVLARYPSGHVEEVDLGNGEWRPRNLHPILGRQIVAIELTDERDAASGRRRPMAVLSVPRF
jgi:hypothetical protein